MKLRAPKWLIFSRPFPSQEKKVHIAAVGIGAYEDFEGQLEEIAGKNVYNASNFDNLSDLFENILAETCSKCTERICIGYSSSNQFKDPMCRAG